MGTENVNIKLCVVCKTNNIAMNRSKYKCHDCLDLYNYLRRLKWRELKEKGICIRCGTKPIEYNKNSWFCKECFRKVNITHRKIRKYRKDNGLCTECGSPIFSKRSVCYCIKCLKKKNEDERHRWCDNPDFRLKKNISRRIRTLLNGNIKTDTTIGLLGCTIKELRRHLESQFSEGMTWENHSSKGWHIDHIIPINNFDLSNPEEQKKCFHYTNTRPLWAKDNLSRKHKVTEKSV